MSIGVLAYVHAWLHTCLHTCLYTFLCACLCTCLYKCRALRLFAGLRVCMRVRMQVLSLQLRSRTNERSLFKICPSPEVHVCGHVCGSLCVCRYPYGYVCRHGRPRWAILKSRRTGAYTDRTTYMPAHISMHMSLHMSIRMSILISMTMCIHKIIHMSIYTYTIMSVHKFMHMSIADTISCPCFRL